MVTISDIGILAEKAGDKGRLEDYKIAFSLFHLNGDAAANKENGRIKFWFS